jgi:hypothetical protein
MSAYENFDVIIVGAGASGLAVGSELSKGLKVLVIDRKEKINHTTKSWFIPNFMWQEGDAKDAYDAAMYPGVNRFVCKTIYVNSNWDARLKGGYCYMDENKLLNYWGGIIQENGKKNGSAYKLRTHYRDHMAQDGEVILYTSNGNYKCKLLIDASGAHSMIQEKFEIRKDYYWWSVYGGIFDLPQDFYVNKRKVQYADYMLWAVFKGTNIDPNTPLQKGRPVLEYEVLDKDNKTIFIFILWLRQAKVPEKEMKSEFEYIMKHEEILAPFRKNGKVQKPKESKWGWYPSGGLPQHIARDHVAFIGSTGCWTTPCGWGMGYIIHHYKEFSKRVVQTIKNYDHDKNALKKKKLEKLLRIGVYHRSEIILNQIIVHFLSNANAHIIDKGITFFTHPDKSPLGEDGPLLVEKVFTLTVTQDEVMYILENVSKMFTIREIIGIITILPPIDICLLIQEIFYYILSWSFRRIKRIFIGSGKKEKTINKIRRRYHEYN